MQDAHAGDSLTICFRDDAWLALNPLTPATLLDYFIRSPFFCLGAVLDRGGGGGGGGGGEDEEAQVPHASAEVCFACRPSQREEEEAGVFSIERREFGVVTAVYTCLRGTLVMAPPLRDLIIARAGRAAVHLKNALKTLRELEEAEARAAQQ
jgi:hypothetical protein